MDNSYYFDLFNDYLVNVKKASSNTLSSYLRDIRQFGDYLASHDMPGYADAGEEEILFRKRAARPSAYDRNAFRVRRKNAARDRVRVQIAREQDATATGQNSFRTVRRREIKDFILDRGAIIGTRRIAEVETVDREPAPLAPERYSRGQFRTFARDRRLGLQRFFDRFKGRYAIGAVGERGRNRRRRAQRVDRNGDAVVR